MSLFCISIFISCQRDTSSSKEQIPIKISPEIQKKVDSILKAERDSILQANGVTSYLIAPPDIGGGIKPCTNHATGNITGTGNGITVSITVNNGIITSFSFSISGIHGAIAQIGQIQQSIHQGVTTYQTVLAGTWIYNGVMYTTNVLVYGNFYNCEATVGGMVLTPTIAS